MSNSIRFSAMVVVLAMVFGAGCSSTDRSVINSTMSRPVTVSVIDTMNSQTLWSMAVPPGQKLVIDLDNTSKSDNPFAAPGVPANKLTWKTYPLGQGAIAKGYPIGKSLDSGVAMLPGTPVKLDLTYDEPAVPASPSAAAASEQAQPAAPAEGMDEAGAMDQPNDASPADEPAAAEAAVEEPASEAPPEAMEDGADAEQPAAEEAPAAAPAEEEAPQDEPIMFK